MVVQNSGNNVAYDDIFKLVDQTDTSKGLQFSVGANTAAIVGILATAFTTSKTLTFPDLTDTLVSRTSTDTLTNKTLSTATTWSSPPTVSIGSDATGDIYYRNSGGLFTRLGIGSSGQFLSVSSGIPSWTTGGAGTGTVTGTGASGQVAYWTSTSEITSHSSLMYSSSGSLSIGGASFNARLNINSQSFTGSAGHETSDILIAGDIGFTGAHTGNLYQVSISNLSVSGTVSQTIPNVAGIYIGSIVAGVNTTITNKYSIWCDSGLSRFDGDGTHVLELPADATGNTTAATGRVAIKVGGATKYVRYYDD